MIEISHYCQFEYLLLNFKIKILHTFISAAPPNKYPPNIIPTKIIAFNHPLSLEVIFSSHAAGMTNETT